MPSLKRCTWFRKNAGADRHRVSQSLRRTEPWSIGEARTREPDAENAAARSQDVRHCGLIQRETGGNLAEILEKVAYTIRERFRILGDLKTLTTSSRLSAWLLCALPIFVALAVTVLNPEYMSVLWKDPRGHYLIAAALFMQITGMLIVRRS